MTVMEYMENTYKDEDFNCRPRIICNDGFSISVQGGTKGHYCQPRELCNIYNKVELGFPSEKDELILEYAECKDEPTETVYGYVPIEIVEQLIKKHGGININETP